MNTPVIWGTDVPCPFLHPSRRFCFTDGPRCSTAHPRLSRAPQFEKPSPPDTSASPEAHASKEPTPSPTPDALGPPLPRRPPARRWPLLVTLLVVALVAVNVYVWTEKYTVDLHARYDAGFTVGYATGNHTGYSLGYDFGYTTGNHTGYVVGYAAGNATGYPVGHTAGLADGYATGYDDGYLQGVADGVGSGYVIRDPTYREALTFIARDSTDLNEYTETYTCHDFTADVKNNAFILGYRCGYVYILLEEGAHAIVCFQTTDRGLIFIEPQDDRIVQLEVGASYWDREYYLPPSFDDTIVSYDIIW